MVAAREGEDDGKVPWAVVVEGLLTTGAFSTSDPVTLAFARLAERFLAPWARIEVWPGRVEWGRGLREEGRGGRGDWGKRGLIGITDGLGKTGLIKAAALKAIATNPKLMTCVAQVRVVEGRVFFRYGSFLEDERKLLRINLAVKMIHEAVVTFELQTLRAELYLNACDDPHSYDNSLSSGRSGFAVLSSQWTPGVTDILFPDPLDLAYQPSYSPRAGQVGEARQERQGLEPLPIWERRQSKAEWRGRALELVLKEANWATSLRVRLHRMSDARPDLLDARLTMWGEKDGVDAKKLLLRQGVVLAEELDDVAGRRDYKYVLVVDEQIGTRDMCRALSGPQAVIRHASGYTEFSDPLLLPGVHYAPVGHSFRDLFSVIEWMQRNDAAVRTMVRNANELAALVCTWHSRVHFWAVLLAKYSSRALENPAAVVAPTPCRGGRARVSSQWANSTVSGACKVERSVDEAGASWSELAKAAGERGASALLEVLGIDGSGMEEMGDDNLDRCSDFCVSGVPEDQWVWLDAEESLRDVYPHDPIGRLWLSTQPRAKPSLQLRDFSQELAEASPPSIRQGSCGTEESECEALVPPETQLFDEYQRGTYLPAVSDSYRENTTKLTAAGDEIVTCKQTTRDSIETSGNGDVWEGEDAHCGTARSSCDSKSSCDSERSCDSDDLSSDDESSSSDDSCSGFSSFGSEDSFETSNFSEEGSALAAEPPSGALAQQNDADSFKPALTLEDDIPFRATWPFGPYRFPPVSPARARESPSKSPNSKGQRVRWCDEEDGGSLVDVREFERSDVEWEDIRLPPRRRRYDASDEDDVCGCAVQ
ncbi:unnamed protein product [Closterium sp. NIES-65]|nr:unnamed protein product [Closterium sp. NIES-65]